MRIAISTDGDFVSAHFGRCPSFTFLEIENGKLLKRWEVPNPGHQPGLIPQFLREQGAQCIVCGGIGPRAQEFMREFGIKVIAGVTASVRDVIEPLCAGTLEGGESSCDHGEGHVCEHHDRQEGNALPAAAGRGAGSAKGRELGSRLDPRFGRCAYFIFIEPEAGKVEALENPNAEAEEGAGIRSAQLMIDRKVKAVLTGNLGPNAFQALKAAGIAAYTGLDGSVEEVLQQYLAGQLVPGEAAGVAGHHGMK